MSFVSKKINKGKENRELFKEFKKSGIGKDIYRLYLLIWIGCLMTAFTFLGNKILSVIGLLGLFVVGYFANTVHNSHFTSFKNSRAWKRGVDIIEVKYKRD